jgi:hypothetical protein
MERKQGTIYRYAATVYALAVAAIGFLVSPLYLVLLVPLAFVRPILRELNLLKDVDEREVLIIYRSSHIAFYVMLMLLVIIFLNMAFVKKVELSSEWLLLLIVPVFAKLAASIIMNYSLRKAGLIIAWAFGAIWTVFALLSHGFSVAGMMQSLIGVAILAGAAISTRWRHIGGPILIIEGGLALILVLRASWSPMMSLFMSLIMGFPLILAGLLIFASKAEEM